MQDNSDSTWNSRQKGDKTPSWSRVMNVDIMFENRGNLMSGMAICVFEIERFQTAIETETRIQDRESSEKLVCDKYAKFLPDSRNSRTC